MVMSGRPLAQKDPDPPVMSTTTKPTVKQGPPQGLLSQLESQLQAHLASQPSSTTSQHQTPAHSPPMVSPDGSSHHHDPFVSRPFKKASSKEDLQLPQQTPTQSQTQEKGGVLPPLTAKPKLKSTSVGSLASVLSNSSVPYLSAGSSSDLTAGSSSATISTSSIPATTSTSSVSAEDGGAPSKPAPYSMTKRKKQMEMLAKALENGMAPGGSFMMKDPSSAPAIPSFSQERRDLEDLEKGGDSDGDSEEEGGSDGEDEGAGTLRGAKKTWNKLRVAMKQKTLASSQKAEDEPDLGRMKSIRLLPKKIEMPSLIDKSFFSPPTESVKKNADGERPKIAMVMKPSILEDNAVELPEKKKWYELSEVQIDITQLSECEMKRQDTIHELIETEESYLHDLEIIIEVYKNELTKQKTITVQEINGLFSNIEQLVGVNQELLKLLKGRREAGIVMKIGDIFLQMASYFRMYNIYCSNQPDAMALFNRLKENEAFQAFLKQAATRKECRSLGLTAFLLEPIQRLCKYPLFMKDVAKNTPEDHTDYEDIKKARQSIEKIVDEVNERRRLVENQQKVLAVQNACDFGEKWKSFALVVPSRKYIREGPLFKTSSTQKVQERYAFLFTDVLLWCSKKRLANSKFQVHQILYLNRCIVVDNQDAASEDPSKTSKFTFNIIHSGEGRYIASLPEASQKREWLEEIKELIAIFTHDQVEEFKDPRADMIFSDEEQDDGADDSEEQVSVKAGHSSSSSTLGFVLPPLTTPPKLAPKDTKEGGGSPKADVFPSLPVVPGEAEGISEADLVVAPRPRKGSAPNRPLPKPFFARSDQNLLANMQPSSSIDGVGQIVPPLTKPAVPNPTSSVASVSSVTSSASTVSMISTSSSVESAPETPASGVSESQQEPHTMLKRQRSLSVPHINLNPRFNSGEKSPGDEKPPINLQGKPSRIFPNEPPVIPPKPLGKHTQSSGAIVVPGLIPQGDKGDKAEKDPLRPPPPILKPKPSLPAGATEAQRQG